MSFHNNITFTELTPDDIATHEDIYISMLVDSAPNPSGILGSLSACIYYEYAIAEVLRAKQIFQKTFG